MRSNGVNANDLWILMWMNGWHNWWMLGRGECAGNELRLQRKSIKIKPMG